MISHTHIYIYILYMFMVWYSIFPDWISITCRMYRGYVLLRALRSRKTPRHGSPSIGAQTKVKNVHTRFEVEDELSSFGAGRHHWVTLFLGCEGGIQPTSKAMMLENGWWSHVSSKMDHGYDLGCFSCFLGQKKGLLEALSISGGTTGEYWW